MDVEEEKGEPFTEVNRILNSLKVKNLDLALEWVERNREHLESQVGNSFTAVFFSII